MLLYLSEAPAVSFHSSALIEAQRKQKNNHRLGHRHFLIHAVHSVAGKHDSRTMRIIRLCSVSRPLHHEFHKALPLTSIALFEIHKAHILETKWSAHRSVLFPLQDFGSEQLADYLILFDKRDM